MNENFGTTGGGLEQVLAKIAELQRSMNSTTSVICPEWTADIIEGTKCWADEVRLAMSERAALERRLAEAVELIDQGWGIINDMAAGEEIWLKDARTLLDREKEAIK